MIGQGLVRLALGALLLAACPPVLAAAVVLAATGQVSCFDRFGNPSVCADTGQDGEIGAGAAWPSPRFEDLGNGTLRDNLTGLVWAQDGNPVAPAACSSGAAMTWQQALDYVTCLNANAHLGIDSWRLPNTLELYSLINAEETNSAAWLNAQGFRNVRTDLPYWTSTSSTVLTERARVVRFSTSTEDENRKTSLGTVLAVYLGPNDAADRQFPANLWKTGQITCHDAAGSSVPCAGTGQDGETRWGVAWPPIRFADRGDGSVLDRLTDLVWTIDAHAPGPARCGAAILMDWQSALDYVACLNARQYLGFTDWRLPNANALKSLADHSQSGPFLSPGHPFLNVQPVDYWTSTTTAANPNNAFTLSWLRGVLSDFPKVGFANWAVWPVRAGGTASPLPATGRDATSDCVIATAAYGSPLHEDLDVLRQFRDEYLMRNQFGRAIVRLYYAKAPLLAAYIADREWLRWTVRTALVLLIGTIKYPLAALGPLLFGALVLVAARRRAPPRHEARAATAKPH